jgi:RNA polymerase sigma factor (sigma-70 family)
MTPQPNWEGLSLSELLRVGCDPALEDEAWRQILHRIHRPLLRYAAKLLGPRPEVIQDCVQEAEIQIWKARFKRRDIKDAWCLSVLHNRVFDHLRRELREAKRLVPGEAVSLNELPSAAETPEEICIKAEQMDKVRRCVESFVDPVKRSVYEMYFEGGKTGPEIAKILGRTPGSVRERLHVIRNDIRRSIGGSAENATTG